MLKLAPCLCQLCGAGLRAAAWGREGLPQQAAQHGEVPTCRVSPGHGLRHWKEHLLVLSDRGAVTDSPLRDLCWLFLCSRETSQALGRGRQQGHGPQPSFWKRWASSGDESCLWSPNGQGVTER